MICKDCKGSGTIEFSEEGYFFRDSCFVCQGTGYLSYSQVRENDKDYLVDYLADLEFGNKSYSWGEFQEAQLKVFRELNLMDKKEPEKVDFLLTWIYQVNANSLGINF